MWILFSVYGEESGRDSLYFALLASFVCNGLAGNLANSFKFPWIKVLRRSMQLITKYLSLWLSGF